MVVAKIRYEEGSYEGEVNEGKGKDDIHFLKCLFEIEKVLTIQGRIPLAASYQIGLFLAAWSNSTFY
jgi:hypothetical protein